MKHEQTQSGQWSVVSGHLSQEAYPPYELARERMSTATLPSRRALRRCVERTTVFGQELREALLRQKRVQTISKRLAQLHGGEQITSEFGAQVRSFEHGSNRRAVCGATALAVTFMLVVLALGMVMGATAQLMLTNHEITQLRNQVAEIQDANRASAIQRAARAEARSQWSVVSGQWSVGRRGGQVNPICDMRFSAPDRDRLTLVCAAIATVDEREHGALLLPAHAVEAVNWIYDTEFTEAKLAADKLRAAMVQRLWLAHHVYLAMMKVQRFNQAMSGAHQETNPITLEEIAARVWRGGPDGWRQAGTVSYAQRVLEEVRGLKAEGARVEGRVAEEVAS